MSRETSIATLSRSDAGHVDATASAAVPGPEPKSSKLSGRKLGTRAESCGAGVSALPARGCESARLRRTSLNTRCSAAYVHGSRDAA